MSDICVDDFIINGNVTDVNEQCVASWYITFDQFVVAGIALAAILFVAVVWVLCSRAQLQTLPKGHLGFDRLLRMWAKTSRFGAIMNRPVQFIVSFGIYITFLVRCSTYTVSIRSFHTLTALYCMSLIDDVVRFLGARNKIQWVFSPFTILETLSIASHFTLGYGPVKIIGGIPSRTWLDFSVLRPIFMYRSFVEMENQFGVSTKGAMLLRLGVKSMLLIFFAAGVIFYLETHGEVPFVEGNGFYHLYECPSGITALPPDGEDCSETWSLLFSFYFTLVTFTTVGYGDNSPATVMSRLLVIVFIVAGIVHFSLQIDRWIEIIQLRTTGSPSFKPHKGRRHVVIVGNPTFVQLNAVLRELFHEDHYQPDEKLHAVILGEKSSSFAKTLIRKIEDHADIMSSVTYIAGNPQKAEDLERAKLRSASAAFFFSNKFVADPDAEDMKVMLSVLAAKRYVGTNFRCLVMLLRATNVRHVVSAGVHRDDVLCEDTLKMGVLAQSCRCPGYSTMLGNLTVSISETYATNSNTVLGKIAGALKQSVRDATDTDLPSTNTGESHSTWKAEYDKGASKELYNVVMDEAYYGLTFAQAAERAFEISAGSVVLIGVEVSINDIHSNTLEKRLEGTRVLLNPAAGLRLNSEMTVYVIAEDVQSIRNFGISPQVPRSSSPSNSQNNSATTSQTEAVDAKPLHMKEINGEAAYAEIATPSEGVRQYPTFQEEIESSNSEYESSSAIELASPLERIALQLRADYSSPHISERTPSYEISNELEEMFRFSEISSLRPPTLDVLLHPRHIVICSYLGETSLETLKYFISPLRGIYATEKAPITILDEADPTGEWSYALSKFQDVYYVRGSPLSYREMQRAGAKSAYAVIVLAQKEEANGLQMDDITNSMVDAEAIFTTMLIELKLELPKIFTITELADQKNSKFIGLNNYNEISRNRSVIRAIEKSQSFFQIALRTSPKQDLAELTSIHSMPRYMSGRLYHPQLCENILVQSYFNPNINRIVRQLVGGPRSTGSIWFYRVPPILRDGKSTYGDLFKYFLRSASHGIVVGVYRNQSEEDELDGKPEVNFSLPVVITCPSKNLKLFRSDHVYVLIGWHKIDQSAGKIQRCVKKFLQRKHGKKLKDVDSVYDLLA